MRQKSLLWLVASWLIVRLRVALLSVRSSPRDTLNVPEVLLVSRREDPYHAGIWIAYDQRLHFMHEHEKKQQIHVQSFPAFERN